MFYRKNVLINYSQAMPSFSNTSGVLLVCRKGGTETAETQCRVQPHDSNVVITTLYEKIK